jgi:hypothetical protein
MHTRIIQRHFEEFIERFLCVLAEDMLQSFIRSVKIALYRSHALKTDVK